MRVPLSWLREFVPVRGSAEALAERLALSGVDIKAVHQKKNLPSVLVGAVKALAPHPNADRLQVATVNIGRKTLTIVCGAPNVAKGQRVAVALSGAVLPDGLRIEKREIRGVYSEGMICSEKELGLSEEAGEGVMILPDTAKLGSRFDVLTAGETVIEAEITPNRGDELSILGIAREVRALDYKKPPKLTLPDLRVRESKTKAAAKLKVVVEDSKHCLQYAARVVRLKKKIVSSPRWLQERLLACGLRPINLVVDVTNYVMLELGQPLHAFDSQKLAMNKIVVRKAKKGERVTTLDGVTRELSETMLVIADGKKPVAVAGVMGAQDAEVTAGTASIVLEAAEFDPIATRKTAQALGLRTEAVSRFEKKIDPELPRLALDRAAHLLQKLGGAEVYEGVLTHGSLIKPATVGVALSMVNSVLGAKIGMTEAVQILDALGFDTTQSVAKSEEGGWIEATAPSFRRDIALPEDLIEEIGRLWGYNRIPSALPSGVLPQPSEERTVVFERTLKNLLAAQGFFEAVNYSFLSEADLVRAGVASAQAVRVKNPLSQEEALLRPSLLPSLLKTAAANQDRFSEIRLFELAAVFSKKPFDEKPLLGGLVSGSGQGASAYADAAAFFAAKGALETLMEALGVAAEYTALSSQVLHPGRSAQVAAAGKVVGWFGELHPKIRAQFDLRDRAAYFELDLELLLRAARPPHFASFSKFPQVVRDISLVVSDTPYHELRKAIAGHDVLIAAVTLKDLYRGKGIPEGKVGMTFRVVFASPERTLTESEVNEIESDLVATLRKRFGAELRA